MRSFLPVALFALLAGCQSAPKPAPVPAATDVVIVAHPSAPALMRTEIVFTVAPAEAEGLGLAIAEGGWRRFMDEEVTPRFSEQVNVVDGVGQWRADATSPIERERTKVLTFVHTDSDEARAKIADMLTAFERRFPEEGYRSVAQPVTDVEVRVPLR